MDAILISLVDLGIIDRDTAEAIARNLDRDEMRLWAERTVMRAFQRGLIGQQSALLDIIRQGDIPGEAFWTVQDEALWRSVQDAMETVAIDNAIAVAWETGGLSTWQLVNDQVVGWVNTYYTSPAGEFVGSIPNLNQTSRQQFATAFERWNRGELGERGLPDLINELSGTFGPERAEKIATTEVTRVFVEGERAAVANNEAIAYMRILTAADERVCPICGPIHGQARPKTQDYYEHPTLGQMYGPPFHVRCRCDEVPVTAATLALNAPAWDVYEFEGALPEVTSG